ncbi:MAG: TrbI/VirB10 family protein [Solidesulfovibrio sp. DCME]|uniref:TrbI/VirB10 family protein n=1 Tax=Solidesulfovibrio sp. DCME TaxID=3447380 RepID=UPI003D11B22B
MSDNSPNEFTPPGASGLAVARMSKKPLILVLLVGLILAAVLIYSVNFSERRKKDDARLTADAAADKPLLPVDAGPGLATTPSKEKSPAILEPQKPIVVVAPKKNDQAEAWRREQEQLRRYKLQAQLSALSSPLSAKKGEQTRQTAQANAGTNAPEARQPESGDAPKGLAASLAGLAPGDYNPAADKDKEAFFSRARQQGGADKEWTLPGTRTPGQPFEVKTGTVIPGVMITGINSDLPGSIIAQVSQNVFDTATGRYLIIPQGAKLFGVYDSRVIYGQSRVLVAWNRIIFPDGSAITLGAMPGADMSGYAGFNDEVNNHYLRVFGSAVLMSLISGSNAFAMDSLNVKGNTSSGVPSMQDEMASALASQLGQTTTKLLEKNLNIKPTLEIRPGYQFNIIVTKDMVMKAPYVPLR